MLKKRIIFVLAGLAVAILAIFILAPKTTQAAIGWQKQSDGYWYYYYSDTGYYSDTAKYIIEDNAWYGFDAQGHMQIGWFQIGSTWYYAYSNGKLAQKWENIKGVWYYFDPDYCYMLYDTIHDVDGKSYYFAKSGAMLTGWIWNGSVWFYADSSGALAKEWKKVDGTWYYFDPTWFYMYSNMFFTEDGQDYYYLAKNGAMLKGWIKDILTDSDGHTYTRWFATDSSGVLLTGWHKINDVWYYFDPYGWEMKAGDVYDIDGKAYYFYPNGAMGIGWCKAVYSYSAEDTWTWWYYANGKGELQTEWQKIGNVYYYFHPDYYMMYTGYHTIKGVDYLFLGNGAWVSWQGWVEVIIDGESDWYYIKSDNSLAEGWEKIGGVYYYFNPYNHWMNAGMTDYIDGRLWAFADNGALLYGSGWVKFSYSDGTCNWVYLENGKVHTGWLDSGNGIWYYLHPETGYMINDGIVVDGKLCLFASNGKWIGYCKNVGWQKIGDFWYYVKSSDGTVKTGWHVDGYTYYLDPYDGTMYYDGIYTIGSKDYFFYKNGAMGYGWIHFDGDWYYAESSGALVGGWKTIGGKKYYFSEDFYYMYSNGIYTIDDVNYEFDENGVCLN